MSRDRRIGSSVITTRVSKRRRRLCRPIFEDLEQRQLLATVDWISTSSGSWDVASNWSTDTVPGPNDDVVIAVSGASPTVTISSNVESVNSITSADPLVISGGGLTVAADSTISGGLDMTGGTLTSSGSGVSLAISGTTTVAAANLTAEGGATLSLTQLSGFSGGVNETVTLEATGSNSLLSLPELATVTGDATQFNSLVQVQALAGGDVELPLLTTISGGPVTLESDGTHSKLNGSALTSFTENIVNQRYFSGLQVTNQATLVDGVLATMNEVDLTLDGTGTESLGQIATFTSGTLTLSGGTAVLGGLTDADASSFLVSGGASLTLSVLASYAGPINATATLQATGTNSLLSLPKLATVTGDATQFNSLVQVQALAGGDVELPLLTTISGGPVTLESDGTHSKLNVSALTSFTENIVNQRYFSGLQVTNQATLVDGVLATMNEVDLTLDGTGTESLGQIATFTSGTLTLSGGTAALGGLTDADSSSFLVSGGASLTLSVLASYAGPINATATLQATGTNSLLSLPELAALTGDTTQYSSLVQVQALAGGDVELPKLTTISGGPVTLESDGTHSKLNVSALTSFTENTVNQRYYSGLQVTNSATVLDGVLGTMTEVNLTLDGTGTESLNQITRLTAGTVTLSGGTAVLGGLTDADTSSFLVSGGASLTLSVLASYAGPINATATLQATGTNSLLSLPELATVTGDATQFNSQVQVQALAGGDVELPLLTTISGGPVTLESDGTHSKLNVSALTSFTENIVNQRYFSGLQVTNQATLVDGVLATMNEVDLTLDGTGTESLGQIATFTSGTLTLSGGTAVLGGLTDADASSFLVSGGASLTLSVLASYAGPINATATLQATGTNSLLSLPKLATVTGDATQFNSLVQVQALAGGDVELPLLTTISGGPVTLESDGTHSKLNVSALTSFTENTVNQRYYSGLQVTNQATVLDGVLATMSEVNLTLDGTGTESLNQITTLTSGTLTLSGGTAALGGLTDADSSSFLVSGGASLTLSVLAGYAGPLNATSTLQATGINSLLSLPELAALTGDTTQYSSLVQVQALAGGDVELPKLTTISGGPVTLESDGTHSKLNVSALTSFTENTVNQRYYSGLQVTNSATVLDGVLGTMTEVNLTLDGTGTESLNQITRLTAGTVTLSGGTAVLGGLTDADTSSFLVSGGASLTLSVLASYAGPINATATLQATGTNSLLSLPELAALTGDTTQYSSLVQVQALAGGDVELPKLTTISGGPVTLESDGAHSKLNVSALTSFTENTVNQRYYSGLQVTNQATVLDGVLATMSEVNLTLDGTGTESLNQITTLTAGTVTLSGGTAVLGGLTDANASSFLVSGGASLTLPALTSYAGPINTTATLEATGTGSMLLLPKLSTLSGDATQYSSLVQVQALAGGDVELPSLPQISGGPVQLESAGADSLLDVTALTSFSGTNAQRYASDLQIINGGTVVDPVLSQIIGVNLIGDSTGMFTISSSLGFTISGGTSTVQTGTLLDEGNLGVQSGATLNIIGGLSVDGSGVLAGVPGSTIALSGDLLGTTQNADDFNPQGTVEFDSGAGTSSPPQLLEAMSDDMGAVQSGFVNNFAYGSISLTNNTSVELVDQSHNTTSTSPEAVYANELVVASGATLNLNGLHLYVRGDEISGTVLDGSVSVVPTGGAVALGTPTPGTLTPAGAINLWTFYGTAGESISIQLNPGSGGSYPAVSPVLGWGQVSLQNASGSSLATASSASSGAFATISSFDLPASGIYTIAVQAPGAESSSTGNYVLSVFNVTPTVSSLTVNQEYTGTISNALGVNQYDFTASAGVQVQLDVIGLSGGVEFDLTGPGGYTAFSDSSSGSGLITLPSTGSYVLTAHGDGAEGGAYAFELDQTSVIDLMLGTPYRGTLAGSGQAQLFEVSVPTTQALVVTLDDSTSTDVNQIYAQLNAPPTPGDYAYEFADGVAANQQLLVPSAAPGIWYILVDTVSVPAASAFTLTAAGEPITLTTVAPAQSATGSTATLTLSGSGFTTSSSVELVSSANTVYTAASVSLDTFTQLTATFDLSGVPQGTYSVVVTNPGAQSASLAGAFTVTAPGVGHFVSQLILPSEIGRHISSTFYVKYSNIGNQAMPAPLLVLDSAVADDLPLMTLDPALVVSGYWTSAIPEGYSNTIEILASGTEVPGWLEPGESITIPVYYAGMQQPWNLSEKSFSFNLDVYTQNDTTAIDLSGLQTTLQQSGLSNSASSALYSGLATQIGATWGGYVKMLDHEASYLGQLGQNVTDVSQLWSFAVAQVDGLTPTPELASATDLDVAVPGQVSLDFSRIYQEPITSRETLGPLGYGWTDDWQYSLSVGSDGTVTVTMPSGEERVFQPDSRGSDYFDQPGDYGILSEGAGGTFSLQETDGQIEEFNANGTLDTIEDTNGNRITAGYNAGGLLSTLTETSGASLSIAYNAQGLIASVTTSDGQTVNYHYNSSEELISVQSYDGEVTGYAYEFGSDAATENALTSITNPDGTSQNFTYNSSGQLTGTSQAGGALPVTYSYNVGDVTLTNAAGDASQYYFDENGDLVKNVDPLGNVTFATYDSDGNLTSWTGSTGLTTSYTYDANGNLISSTDALGQTTSYTYTSSDNLLASVTNAQGDTTNYTYNASGDLTSTEYPDDTVETATYDALGDPLSLTDQDGEATNYTYNSAGQVTSETLAGGSTMTYTYDAQGNLSTATDSTGITTLIYNSADELTSVVYPTGLSLQYTYNAAGQRTQMVELSGSTVTETVNYSYNGVGQLLKLTDGNGNLIISYTYNSIGELTREDMGDGTYSTYTYDADGNVLDLVNYAANGTIDSSFAYTYNALYQVTSMATVDGMWTYGYDNDGELVSAAFASTDSAIPDQNQTYIYNAAGDRTQTIINGVTTNYTSNSVNEYTTVGGTTYGYDADGNLISMSDASGTTTYSYNSLNQLVGVDSPSGNSTYQYNALGDLVATTANGETTDNLVDPTGLGNLVGQYTTSGSLIAGFTYGLGLVSQVTPGGTNYYQFDLLGSTAGVTNATNGLVASYSYLPFGGLLSSTGSVANPFTFLGQSGATSDGNGDLNMKIDQYDPNTGQFITNDPLGLAGGDVNLRRYAGNDPVSPPHTATIIAGSSPPMYSFLPTTAPTVGLPPGSSPYGYGPLPGPTPILPFEPPPESYSIQPVSNPGKSLVTKPKPPSKPKTPVRSGYLPLHVTLGYIKPKPVTVVCKPLSPSDTGYGFFSGSVGSLSGCNGGGGGAKSGGSYDPNSMSGPTGSGSLNFVTGSALTLFPYQISFENSPTATAPAQQVVITDTLDADLDLSTFQLTGIGFGDTVLTIPPGAQNYQTIVPMTYNGVTFDVDINASLNYETRQLTITFQSVDPSTQLPPSVLTGFLPPENGTGRGEGYVSFVISPNGGLATGTQISNVADIVFDGQTPIATDQVSDEDPSQGIDPTKEALITIDNTVPTSTVAALPATETSTTFTVNWSGSDGDGSGIEYYNVYVSDDGGAFDNLMMSTTQTSTTFTGQAGHTYSFISIATSNVGTNQPAPSVGQATTKVVISQTPTPTPTPPPPPPPPPLVTVESLQVEKIKVGTGKKAKKETVLVLQFSGALNAAAADNVGAYELAPVIKVRATGKGKNKKPATTKLGKSVALASAVYTGSNNHVTLTPRATLNLTKPEELIVNAQLVTDALGRPIDGNDDGQAGGDYIATLTGSRVTVGGVPAVRTHQQPENVRPAAIDALLARGVLAGVTRSPRG